MQMIDPIAFQLGPFSIRWYALCIVAGLILAVYLSAKEAPRKRIREDDVYDFILYLGRFFGLGLLHPLPLYQ